MGPSENRLAAPEMRLPFSARAVLSIVILAVLTFPVARAIRGALSTNPGRSASGKGSLPEAPPSPAPDERFKADILVIVAHPDDATIGTGWLAQQVLDHH